MASSMRRSVFSAIGVLSPIGNDTTNFWNSLINRQGGIRPMKSMDATELSNHVVGEIVGFDAKKWIVEKDARKMLRMMSRTVQLGVAVAEQTLKSWDAVRGSIDPTRIGVEFGSGMIHTELDDIGRASKLSTNCLPGSVSFKSWGEIGMKEINPLWMLKYLPNMPACHVTINHNLQGPSNTITSGDVSSLLALGEAWRILDRNTVDYMLVGCCESKLNPLNYVRQSLFQPLTHSNHPPEAALRPFDLKRDGTVLGEGASAVILESLETAASRGAKIYGELVGFASGFDCKRDGFMLEKIIRRALKHAEITPDQIDHINAHGLGTTESDLWESKGIAAVFGKSVPVWGLKGFFGAAGPAGSLVEMMGSLLAMEHGQLPVTLNHEQIDPNCPILVQADEVRPIQKPYFLKLSLTELGHVAVAIVRRWDH